MIECSRSVSSRTRDQRSDTAVATAVTTVLATGASARYGNLLLNGLASIQRRSNIFDRVLAFDLGLTPFQRRLLEGMRGVEIRAVPPFVPHWAQGFTWKTWIWTHVDADAVVWLDAGVTVLRPLDDLVVQIGERGYFAVSQEVPVRDCIPSDYYGLYGLDESVGDKPTIAAGVIGFAPESDFFSKVIVPTYEDAMRGMSLGFSTADVEAQNRGLQLTTDVIVRDCPRFRWDQTLLNIHIYKSMPDLVVNDMNKYAGWRSPRDHPQQVLWHHRRRGDYRALPRARYRQPTAFIGVPWGIAIYLRALYRNYRWILRPAFYRGLFNRLGRRRSQR